MFRDQAATKEREMTEEELRKAMKPYEDIVPSEEVMAQWAKETGFDIETVRDIYMLETDNPRAFNPPEGEVDDHE
jgi:hypothetical protein